MNMWFFFICVLYLMFARATRAYPPANNYIDIIVHNNQTLNVPYDVSNTSIDKQFLKLSANAMLYTDPYYVQPLANVPFITKNISDKLLESTAHICVGFYTAENADSNLPRSCQPLMDDQLKASFTSDHVLLCKATYIFPGGDLGNYVDTYGMALAPSYESSLVFDMDSSFRQSLVASMGTTDLFNQSLKLCIYQPQVDRPSEPFNRYTVPEDLGVMRFIKKPTWQRISRISRVPIRIFINPGWDTQVDFYGFDFSTNSNLVSLKLSNCSGFFDSFSYISASVEDVHIRAPSNLEKMTVFLGENFERTSSRLPQWYTLFKRERSGKPSSSSNDLRLLREQNVVYKTKVSLDQERKVDPIISFRLCFYASNQQYNGIDLGPMSFYSDPIDSFELIGFIIFSVMLIPFICGITFSCYYYRHQKLRQKLRRMRLLQQRDEIEQRLYELLEEDDDETDAHQ